MDADQLKKLTDPFPKDAIKTRKLNPKDPKSREVSYVEGFTVIRRLNEVTGNNWNLEVLSLTSDKVGGGEVLRAQVRLTIPGLGSREHIGIQSLYSGSGEDLAKGVITDALKKAATLFGIGLELYGPDYEAEDYQPAQASQTARPAPTPARPAVAPQSAPQASQRPPQRVGGIVFTNGNTLTPEDVRALKASEGPIETRNTFLEWVSKNNVASEAIRAALGTDNAGDWLKAHPGEGWAGLKKAVADAVFPGPADESERALAQAEAIS